MEKLTASLLFILFGHMSRVDGIHVIHLFYFFCYKLVCYTEVVYIVVCYVAVKRGE